MFLSLATSAGAGWIEHSNRLARTFPDIARSN